MNTDVVRDASNGFSAERREQAWAHHCYYRPFGAFSNTSFLMFLSLLSFFFFSDCVAQPVGSQFADHGLNLGPWEGKCPALTPGPPGNSLLSIPSALFKAESRQVGTFLLIRTW